MKGFDMVDLKILELLQKDARMTLKDIAARVYLTSPAVSARIDKLEKSGVIEGYHATINPDAFKLQGNTFVNLNTSSFSAMELSAIRQRLTA